MEGVNAGGRPNFETQPGGGIGGQGGGAVVPAVPLKIGLWGGEGGDPKDVEGTPFLLQKISLRSGDAIDSLAFVYVDAKGQITRTAGPWGGNGGNPSEIILGSGEFLKAINGTIGRMWNYPNVIRSLTFVTNVKTYGPYGKPDGTPFSVPVVNGQIVAFFARSGQLLDAIGVYVKL